MGANGMRCTTWRWTDTAPALLRAACITVLAAGLSSAAFAQRLSDQSVEQALATDDAAQLEQAQAAVAELEPSSTPAQRATAYEWLIDAAERMERADVALEHAGAIEALVPALPTADRARIAAKMTLPYAVTSQFDLADVWRARAEAALAQMPDAAPGTRALIAYGIAMQEGRQGNIFGSEQAGLEALHLARQAWGPDGFRTVAFVEYHARYAMMRSADYGEPFVKAAEQELARKLPPEHPLRLEIMGDLVQVALNRGRYDDALSYGSQIIDTIRALEGPTAARLYGTMGMQSVAASAAGELEYAEELVRGIFDVLDANPQIPTPFRAMNHEQLANVLLRMGRIDEAEHELRVALATMEGTPQEDIRWPIIRSRLAHVLSLRGKDEEALALAEPSLVELKRKTDPSNGNYLRAELEYAAARARAGEPKAALSDLLPVANSQLDRLVAGLVREGRISALMANSYNMFDTVASIGLRAGDEETAWRFAQYSALSDFALATMRIQRPGDASDLAALTIEIDTARKLEAEAREAVARGTGDSATLVQASEHSAQLEGQLEAHFAAFSDAIAPEPLSIAQAQANIPQDAAYILPLDLEDRVTVIVVTRDGFYWDETPGERFVLRKNAQLLRASLERGLLQSDATDGFDAEAAQRLHDLILTPAIQTHLVGKQQLIFPASGPLASIPPSVLLESAPEPGQPLTFLVRSYSVSIAALLDRAGTRSRAGHAGFAGIGDPDLDRSRVAGSGPFLLRSAGIAIDDIRKLPALPSSARELAALAEVLGSDDALVLRGPAATEAAVKTTDLSDFGVIAFATHALVSGDIEGLDEPALVLTPAQDPDVANEGLLKASEISRLRLGADWIILSACNTAAGDSGRATYSGLARAFNLAGAHSLMLSHWPVRDDVATFLSVETLRLNRSGLPKAEALRQAQLALMARSDVPGATNPSVWAPFVLIDN